MASFAPIALTIPNYRDFKNYWLKAFTPGTTTPLPGGMATDKTGGTTVAKFELDKDGFPKTSGGALITPYIKGAYDLWAFPTEAEADANDTGNALRFAIDVNADPTVAADAATDDHFDRLNPATLAAWQNDTSAQLGDVATTKEYFSGTGGGGAGDIIASGTETGFGIVKHNTLPLSWALRHNGTITPEQFGVDPNGAESSPAVQAIFDDLTVHRVNGNSDSTYFFKLIDTNKQRFTWDGGTFKFNRTSDVEINTFNWNDWLSPFLPHSTGAEWLLRFTKPAIGDSGVMFKNITIEGNGEPFVTSANYPNQFVKMIDIVSCRHIIFDNVHIKRNNGNGFFVYNSEYIQFTNGSVLETVGLTGAITPFEQISLIASRHCTVANNDLGRMTPNSCINTAGGFVDVLDGTEVGGFVPFNSPDGVDNSYIYFGLATGGSDTFHRIHDNTCRSDLVDAAEAGGGGVLGRMITINSGRCFVKDNLVYDETNKSNGGIGLGHDNTTVTVDPTYGRMASRTEVSGNIVYGFRKDSKVFGILNDGAEDCNVHDNELYNNSNAIRHQRAATTSRYVKNWCFFNDIAFAIGDFAGQAASHGIISLVQITSNDCWNNLQDIVTLDNTTYADLSIKDNDFVQTASNSLIQFDIFHGLLEFNDNRIVNQSTAIVGEFFTRGVDRHVECSDNTVECLNESAAALFFFDGSSGDVIGRGRLVINGLSVDCPAGTLNRQLSIRRLNTKDCSINDLHFTNCGLLVATKSGNVSISGGSIETQGTDFPITLALTTTADAKMITVSDIQFPAFGSATAASTGLSATAGWMIFNNCSTQENKDISDRVNGNQMRSNNCYKVTADVLTASRP